VRVTTYNILDGAAGRLDEVAGVIAATASDAVALVEATTDSAAALASELDLQLALGEGNSPIGHHIAWLTRAPPAHVRNHRLPTLSKTLLEIELDDVRLFAAHLASRHEDDVYPREGEIAAILETLGRVDDPHLLLGDFNALRADDPIGTPPAGTEPRGDALPGAPRLVLAPLVAAGYVDCFRARHDDPGFTYPAHAPWLRVDYAFASPALAPRLIGCHVVQDELAARASDHLPLVVELRPAAAAGARPSPARR
jgi:endonuclease/exonuclease/phosphatase family metal-dependent hydrolase